MEYEERNVPRGTNVGGKWDLFSCLEARTGLVEPASVLSSAFVFLFA